MMDRRSCIAEFFFGYTRNFLQFHDILGGTVEAFLGIVSALIKVLVAHLLV